MYRAAFAIDSRGRVTRLNRAAENLFGVTAEEVLGRPYGPAFSDDPAWSGLDPLIARAGRLRGKRLRGRVELVTASGVRHLRVRVWRTASDEIFVAVKDVTERVRAWRRRKESGLFGRLIAATGLAGIAVHVALTAALPVEGYSVLFAWIYLAVLVVPAAWFVRGLAQPLAAHGVTIRNWRKAVREGLLASVFLVSLAFAAARQAELSIDGKELELLAALYLPHVFLQEFVARGVLQSSLARIFSGPQWQPVALAAGIFGAHHVYLGAAAVGLTFASGLMFGWLYQRHGNLIGVTLVHFFGGWAAFMFGLL